MVIYSGISHWKWWFPIAMLNYQRVSDSDGYCNGKHSNQVHHFFRQTIPRGGKLMEIDLEMAKWLGVDWWYWWLIWGFYYPDRPLHEHIWGYSWYIIIGYDSMGLWLCYPIPFGKRLHNYGKSQFLMGKSTINDIF